MWQLDRGNIESSLPSTDFSSIFSFLPTLSDIQQGLKLQPTSISDDELPPQVQIPAGVLPNFSGEYMIRMFYIDPLYFASWEYEDVTLATQCSANHLHHVVMLAERWSGPISVAVFGPNLDASFATDAILSMQACWPDIRKRVTFHLIYPAEHPADLAKSTGSIVYSDCEELRKIIHDFGGDDDLNYKNEIPYPHNVLRNAARKGSATEFVFLIDVDVMPSLNIRDDFNKFATRHSLYSHMDDMVVFVVPVFEIQKGYVCPNDKHELKKSCDLKEVRSFHEETCKWCHEPEQPQKWLQLPHSSRLDISFNSTWTKSWEPFYIGRRSVPLYDERFMVYGFDRIQQICELHAAGYKFSVLNNAFLVHDGWKFPDEGVKKLQDHRRSRNWMLFHFHYQQTLLKMYSNPNTCAPIDTFIPRGKAVIAQIRSRKNRIRRKYMT